VSGKKSDLGVCLEDKEGKSAAPDAVPVEDAEGTEEIERGDDSFSKANVQQAACCSMSNATCSCSPLFQQSPPRHMPGPEEMSELEMPEVMLASTAKALVAESPPSADESMGGMILILQEMSERSQRSERRVLEFEATLESLRSELQVSRRESLVVAERQSAAMASLENTLANELKALGDAIGVAHPGKLSDSHPTSNDTTSKAESAAPTHVASSRPQTTPKLAGKRAMKGIATRV